MKALLLALEVRDKYNKMNLLDCVHEFEESSGQEIPSKAVIDFAFTGLSNTDFFTSDWLNKYGLKNLYQADLK